MLAAQRIALGILLIACVTLVAANNDKHAPGDWHPTWAVEVPGGADVARAVAAEHGFEYLRDLVGDHHHFAHVCNTSVPCLPRNVHAAHRTDPLLADARVASASQQRVLQRTRRAAPSPDLAALARAVPDPQFPSQWYLYRAGRLDHNVLPVWAAGVTGVGVVVTVVDDGIEYTHDDLKANYDAAASTDLNGNDADPFPNEADPINKHGTRCCGEIAAARNGVCGTGVAYGARIGAVRMLDGPVTDAVEAASLGLNPQHIDIYSNSWGPDDDGATLEGPNTLARRALEQGVSKGRGGRGSIFVFANGNGGSSGDNCNCDGYTNSMYTISIGAVTESDAAPYYSESCAATMAVTYSSGSAGDRAIVSVDLHNGCTNRHSGTSAAAPLAAGLLALALSANPQLTWRDMQHIVVRGTATQLVAANDGDWQLNKAGHHINHRFGFGLLDAHKMVELAKTWQLVGPQLRYSTPTDSTSHHVPFATRAESGLVVSTTIGAQDTAIRKLEHVQVTLYLNAQYRGDIVIELEAPSGTRSVLLTRRTRDYSPTIDWTFMTVRHWDEMPVGTWKLYVRNAASPSRTATLGAWSIILYGTSGAGSAPTCAQGQYLAASGECQACDDECTSAGCTGAGPSACISCAHMHTADGECVFDCGDKGLLNPGVPHGQCLHCDDACAKCHGPTANDCDACKHLTVVKPDADILQCANACPFGYYLAEDEMRCLRCDGECLGCVGPTAANCEVCAHVTSSDGELCLASCPTGTYSAAEGDETRCASCHPECAPSTECSGGGPLSCTACAHLSVRGSAGDGGHAVVECVPSCPSAREPDASGKECVCRNGTYAKVGSLDCAPCHPECGGPCTGPTLAECQGPCRDFQFRDVCLGECPVMTYGSANLDVWRFMHPELTLRAAKVCMSCNPLCASGCTGPGPDECSGEPLCTAVSAGGVCMASCPKGSYAPDQGSICAACNPLCATCTGPALADCDACAHVRRNGVCAAACAADEYLETTGSCSPCHPECGASCYGPSEAQCFASAAAAANESVLPVCSHARYRRTCVASCPVGTYRDAAGVCAVCDVECGAEGCTGGDSAACHACKHVELNGICVRACPADMYVDLTDGRCQPCDASCAAGSGCTGPQAEDCADSDVCPPAPPCPPGQSAAPPECTCTGVCTGVTTADGDCAAACPAAHYADAKHTCQPCPEHCAACDGPLPSACTACLGLRLTDRTGAHKCVATCPDGYYADEVAGECKRCDVLCATCYGAGDDACMSCAKAVTPEGQCVASCKGNTFAGGSGSGSGSGADATGPARPVTAPAVCQPCHSECAPSGGGCTGPSAAECAACRHVQLNGECASVCPRSMYAQDGVCHACHAQCAQGCSGPGPAACSGGECLAFRDAVTGACVAACPANTYAAVAFPTTPGSDAQYECHPCAAACGASGCSGPGAPGCDDPDSGTITTRTSTTTASATRRPSVTTPRSPAPSPGGQGKTSDPEGTQAAVKTARWEIGLASVLLVALVAAVAVIAVRWRRRKTYVSGTWNRYSVLTSDFQDEDLLGGTADDEDDDDEEEVFDVSNLSSFTNA